ncbi:MAG: hypothetical protein Q4G27_01285 [Flavobacteriaceae bacterium]|nr:hypothetical protein [Flavobacteriaceae bacterium]
MRKLENLPPLGFIGRLRQIGGQMGGLVGISWAFGAAMGAWNGIKAIYNKGVELEQTNIKFEVLLGSAEKASALLGKLNRYADITPYDNQSIQKSAETMLGFGIFKTVMMGVNAVVAVFNFLLNANPIGVVVIAIGVLAAALVFLAVLFTTTDKSLGRSNPNIL